MKHYDLRNRRRLSGLCVKCAAPRNDSPSVYLCAECFAAHRARLRVGRVLHDGELPAFPERKDNTDDDARLVIDAAEILRRRNWKTTSL